MRTMKRFVSWLVPCGLALLVAGCPGRRTPPTPITGSGAWDVDSPRVVEYEVTVERSLGGQVRDRTGQIVRLDFRGSGQVEVVIDGAAQGRFTMSDAGQLRGTRLLPTMFDVFGVMPPRAAMATPQAAAQFLFPDEATRQAGADTVIYGSSITTTVETPGAITSLRLEGTAGLVANAGQQEFLRSWIGPDPLPMVEKLIAQATTPMPYLQGTARFDTARGELVAASLEIVELPFLNGAPEVGQSTVARLEAVRR